MPIPTVITDLSTTASSNYPDGDSESPIVLDDVQRAHAAFIAQLRDDPTANIVTPVPVADGGTGAATSAAAPWALKGANTDITSLSAPALGAATATTAAGGTNTNQVATTAMVQAAIPLSTAITGVRRIAQIQSTQTGAVNTGIVNVIPRDDTIPQITEGDEYMTVAITPTSAGSTLEVEVSIMVTHSVLTWVTTALFRDSTANALAAAMVYGVTTTTGGFITFKHRVVAGSTSATTFRVRAGGADAGTMTFNGVSGGRQLGGVMASSITVTEVLA